jgi:hypothetical protein
LAAAQSLNIAPPLVANVHAGLSRHDEAALFDQLNRQRRRLTTADHWRARLAAGDPTVTAIEQAVDSLGLYVSDAPKNGNVRCTATLEKLHALGGTRLITDTIGLIRDCWGWINPATTPLLSAVSA